MCPEVALLYLLADRPGGGAVVATECITNTQLAHSFSRPAVAGDGASCAQRTVLEARVVAPCRAG